MTNKTMPLTCSRILDGGYIDKDNYELIEIDDIVLADTIVYKSDRLIRFLTVDGNAYAFRMSGSLSIMGEMLAPMGFWRSDTRNLVNMQHVERVEETLFKAEIAFKGVTARGDISRDKLRALKKMFPDIPVIKAGVF